jgi:hypothetical protein
LLQFFANLAGAGAGSDTQRGSYIKPDISMTLNGAMVQGRYGWLCR